jgi:branched-chain amino acid transport system ATP-binding protein
MSDTILDVDGVNIFYGKSQVVRDVSFSIEKGEVVSIIGPNGAGKTTLFNSLSGLKEFEGSAQYLGDNLSELSTEEITKRGLIHCTEERDLFPYFSVRQNLLLGAHTRTDNEQIEKDLEMVNSLFPRLDERKDQKAKTLSGGEQQMLAIGRALMSDPELLLLDEPTLGLAPVIIQDIMEAIEDLQQRGVTILLAEQNVTFGIEQSERMYLLENGEIKLSGSADEFKDNDYIQESYIGIA